MVYFVHIVWTVRQSDTVLPLSDILSSLSSVSLDSHISVLRRDLSTHYVDYVLKQPASVTTVTNNAGLMNAEHKLTVFRAPPSDEVLSTRIENIITVLTFLDKHLFPHLPSHLGFSLSLCKPLTAALLDRLLIPSLPSSVDQLPQFLTLVKQAVEFEQTYIGELLGEDMAEKKVKSWADAVGSHYERRRRVDFLERARTIILRPINDKESFVVEIISMEETKEPTQATTPVALDPPPSKPPPIAEEAVWNFEDEDSADEWGLDDDVEREPEIQVAPPEAVLEPHPEPEEEEPDDPWGWNDDNISPVGDGDTSTDSSAWDDPWDGPAITVEAKPAKAATKLEKYSSGKGKSTNGTQVLQSPTPLVAPPTTPAMPPSMKEQPVIANAPQSTIVKETYAVSSKMKEIMSLVQDVLLEASDLSSSGILSPFEPNTSQIGDIISQAASLSLDLYRAIYPVTFATKLEASPKQSLGFSNDCLWLSEEILTVVADSGARGATEIKLEESATRIKVLGESWFEEAIVRDLHSVPGSADLKMDW